MWTIPCHGMPVHGTKMRILMPMCWSDMHAARTTNQYYRWNGLLSREKIKIWFRNKWQVQCLKIVASHCKLFMHSHDMVWFYWKKRAFSLSLHRHEMLIVLVTYLVTVKFHFHSIYFVVCGSLCAMHSQSTLTSHYATEIHIQRIILLV